MIERIVACFAGIMVGLLVVATVLHQNNPTQEQYMKIQAEKLSKIEPCGR